MDILNQIFGGGTNEGVPWGRQTNPFVDFMRQLVLKLTEGAGNTMGVSPMDWWNEWQGATQKSFKDEAATADAMAKIKEQGIGTIPTSASSFFNSSIIDQPDMINYPDLAQKLGFTQETNPMQNIGGISGVNDIMGKVGGFSPDRGIMPTIDVETPEHKAEMDLIKDIMANPDKYNVEKDYGALASGQKGVYKTKPEPNFREAIWKEYFANPNSLTQQKKEAINVDVKPEKPDALDKLLGRTEGFLTREHATPTGPPVPADMIKQQASDMLLKKALGLDMLAPGMDRKTTEPFNYQAFKANYLANVNPDATDEEILIAYNNRPKGNQSGADLEAEIMNKLNTPADTISKTMGITPKAPAVTSSTNTASSTDLSKKIEFVKQIKRPKNRTEAQNYLIGLGFSGNDLSDALIKLGF